MGSDSSPVAASIIAFIALAVIIAVLVVLIYRRRKGKNSAVLPVWETERRQGFEDENLDEIPDQTKSFLPEEPSPSDADSNEITKV
jgi:hypothetical protein